MTDGHVTQGGQTLSEDLSELLKRYVDEPMLTEEAAAYGQAQSVEDLCFAAGRPVAVHASEMVGRIGLAWHGALWIAGLRAVTPSRWKRYVTVRLEAFTACAVADVAGLRELVGARRHSAPGLSKILQRIVVAACVHAAAAVRLSDEDKGILQSAAVDSISALLDNPDWSRERFVNRVLDVAEERHHEVDPRQRLEFVGKTMLEGTAINVVAFVTNLERLGAARGAP